jgi:hypothetical protein
MNGDRTIMNPYAAALKRFWWILAIGVAIAAVAATVTVYKVSAWTFPPTLSHRQHRTFTSSALLMVNSSSVPYLRTDVATPVKRPVKAGASPALSVHAPDTHALVAAANLYPLLIESDQVAAKRKKMFGALRGTVTAEALYSFATPSRFKQSAFPVIKVTGQAPGPKAAANLAQSTAAAFSSWLVSDQASHHVPVSQRVVVQELQTPRGAVGSSSSSKSLALAIAVGVFLAFAALAVGLDRFRPRREPIASTAEGDAAEPAPDVPQLGFSGFARTNTLAD